MQFLRDVTAVSLVWMVGAAVAANGQTSLPVIDPAQARLVQTIASLDGAGCAIALNAESQVLAVATDRGSIQLWERDALNGIRRGERTPYILQAHAGAITALDSRGPYLASAGSDKKLCLWRLSEGKQSAIASSDHIVRSLALAPDGRTLAVGGEDGAIGLFEIPTLKPTGKLTGPADWVTALGFRADGRQLAAGTNDGQVYVWDLTLGQRLFAFPARAPAVKDQPPLDNTVLALAWNPEGDTLAVGGTDKAIHFFRAADGTYLRTLAGHTGAVTSLAYFPDGNMLASASKDRGVRLWRTSDGQALKTLEGHAAWVEGAAFLAQGARLVTIGADRTLRIWDLSPAPTK